MRVARVDDIREGEPLLVELEDEDVTLFRVGSEVFATEDVCTHAEASLSEGEQEGYRITCPRHGGQFDIRTGRATHFPAFSPIRTFPVSIREGDVYIAVND